MPARNTKLNKFKIPLMSSVIGIGGMFLFSYLTFIPKQVFATDIVDPNEHRSLSQINTMQEMSTQICINSRENETKQLLDDRTDDSGQKQTKRYWVTKLKDGNCWMTQNLAYNGGGIKQCELNGNISCSGWPDRNDDVARYAIGTHVDGDHSSQGNYYSWEAAMNGSTSATGNVQGVCPNGWQLPTSNKANSQSFDDLIRAYSIGDNAPGSTALRNEPLYFVYGGLLTSGQLGNVDSQGRYWSSTLYPNTDYAYYLAFGEYYVVPSNKDFLYRGFPVRCVSMANYPQLDDNSEANVAITVSPIINLDVTKSADDMVVDFNSIDTSTIDINVSSNQKYQVTLTTDQPNLTPHKSDNSEYSIKMVGSNGGVVEKGKNGWGIKKKLSATDDNNLGSLVDEPTYSPIGTNNDQVTFYRSAGPEALTNQIDPANPLQLEVGVSVDQSLPSDTYSTMVTVTAMAY